MKKFDMSKMGPFRIYCDVTTSWESKKGNYFVPGTTSKLSERDKEKMSGEDERYEVEEERVLKFSSLNPEKEKPDHVEITHRKHKEEHSENPFGPYVKAMVYAGLDGIVSIYVGVIIAVLTTGEHERSGYQSKI